MTVVPSGPPPATIIPCTDRTVLSGEDIGFAYEAGVTALSHVSFAVSRGEKVALLGANGSGKSTLLKILNGLLTPDTGCFTAFGQTMDARALQDEDTSFAFRRRVGFVFQNSDAQLFSSTVRDELAFGPLQLGLQAEQVEQRLRDVATMLEITRLLDRAPFHLSGGEKKRVAIASVLTINPEVLLLDEPSSGLDPRTRQWLVGLIVTLHKAGKTIVTATHDLDIVPEIADRVVVMDEEHRIVAEGNPRDILANNALLTQANLVHDHFHWHGSYGHSHPHHHGGDHDHTHEH
jgi:cobalt/nickel transport system ATP-binding protein